MRSWSQVVIRAGEFHDDVGLIDGMKVRRPDIICCGPNARSLSDASVYSGNREDQSAVFGSMAPILMEVD